MNEKLRTNLIRLFKSGSWELVVDILSTCQYDQKALAQVVAKSMVENSNLLIVDDDPQVLEICEAELGEVVNNVILAQNGVHALQTCLQTPIDLIISDMKMPQMDGGQLLQTITAKTKKIPLILMSGFEPDKKQLEKFSNLKKIIEKPIKFDELKSMVKSILLEKHALDLGQIE